MPQTVDPHFHQSLIYVLEHGETGAWGVVINQEIGMDLGEVLAQLDIDTTLSDISDEDVLDGGPVDKQHGLVLHKHGPKFDSTREFDGGVALSSSRDVLEALAIGDEPAERLVLLGHAGWGPGQLEEEIADNVWLTCAADTDVIFSVPLANRRDAVGALLGIQLHAVVGQSGHA